MVGQWCGVWQGERDKRDCRRTQKSESAKERRGGCGMGDGTYLEKPSELA